MNNYKIFRCIKQIIKRILQNKYTILYHFINCILNFIGKSRMIITFPFTYLYKS